MRTNLTEREVGFIGDFKSKNFYIQQENVVHIVNILRNKLYNNKVLAVIREYVTNAIDATIENKSSRPIEITLPSEINHYFKVRDFGKGLSQDEIEQIFISYGASTKRDSNDFTGCIGIGSKAAFSYSESFLISSYYEGKLYTYAAYLDDTGLGSISLFNSVPSTEDSGLEISIPIKNEDFFNFKSEFENYRIALSAPYKVAGDTNATMTPNIFQDSYGVIQTPSGKYALNSPEMFLQENHNYSLHVVMGNVNYNIDREWFLKNVDNAVLPKTGLIIFKTPIGEIEFSSNREQIEMTPSNAKSLGLYVERFKEFYFESIKTDFFNKSPHINSYQRFCVGLKLNGLLKDEDQNRIFDLSKLEYTLDTSQFLDLTHTIIAKSVVTFGERYRFRNVFNKKELENWAANNKSVFNLNNYPLLILGTNNKAKDEITMNDWRNSLITYDSVQEVKSKFCSQIPNCRFFTHSGTRNGTPLPTLMLVYPMGQDRTEYMSKIKDLGFFILDISELKNYKSSESAKFTKQVTIISPKPSRYSSYYQNFKSIENLEFLYENLESNINIKKPIKFINCKSLKIAKYNKEIFLKHQSYRLSIYDPYNDSIFNRFLDLCSRILDFTPVLIDIKGDNLGESKYEVISFEEFESFFIEKCFQISASFSPLERHYLASLRLGGYGMSKNFDQISCLVHPLGFRDITSFSEFISWLPKFMKNYEQTISSIITKNTGLDANFLKLKRAIKYLNSTNGIATKLPSSRKEFIESLYSVTQSLLVTEVDKEVKCSLEDDLIKYIQSLLRKIMQRNTFLFPSLNYIRHEVFGGYYLTSSYDSQRSKDIENIISKFIIPQGF